MKFTEEKLEQGDPHHRGDSFTRPPTEVLIKSDLRAYLAGRCAGDGITGSEIDSIVRQRDTLLGKLQRFEVLYSPRRFPSL